MAYEKRELSDIEYGCKEIVYPIVIGCKKRYGMTYGYIFSFFKNDIIDINKTT